MRPHLTAHADVVTVGGDVLERHVQVGKDAVPAGDRVLQRGAVLILPLLAVEHEIVGVELLAAGCGAAIEVLGAVEDQEGVAAA